MASTPDLQHLLIATSRTFAINIPRLPAPLDRQVTVAYLLFRIADTFEDATLWKSRRRIRALGAFAGLLEGKTRSDAGDLAAVWSREPPVHSPHYRELLEATPGVLAAFESLDESARTIIRDHLLRTIEGMADEVAARSAGESSADLEGLRRYCWIVAGLVGEMLTELFLAQIARLGPVADGMRQRAATFGEALQLVNILKDAATDAAEGRRYLPSEVERAGVVALARRDLEIAAEYVGCLERAGAPAGLILFCALPLALAGPTLDRVERDGPGAKLSRVEVAELVATVESAVAAGRSALAQPFSRLAVE